MGIKVRSEVTGSVCQVLVTDGAEVRDGDTLLLIEAMKMEIPLDAACSGVCRIFVAAGDSVGEGDVVAEIG